jgi:autotransporter-associated beta strand protein
LQELGIEQAADGRLLHHEPGIARVSGTGGSLTKVGTGTLSGANTYTGATTVNGATLDISGSLASTSIDIGATGTMEFLVGSSANGKKLTNAGNLNFLNASRQAMRPSPRTAAVRPPYSTPPMAHQPGL